MVEKGEEEESTYNRILVSLIDILYISVFGILPFLHRRGDKSRALEAGRRHLYEVWNLVFCAALEVSRPNIIDGI